MFMEGQLNHVYEFKSTSSSVAVKQFGVLCSGWDCKFDYRRKSRIVLQGDKQIPPANDAYSGVVSLTGVMIIFLLAILNKLQLWAADIGNAFLNGITRDKLYIITGPEFASIGLEGHTFVIAKVLYGLKSSGLQSP